MSTVHEIVTSPIAATLIGGLLTLGGVVLKDHIDVRRQRHMRKLELLSDLYITTKKLMRLHIERLDHQLWFAFYKRVYTLIAYDKEVTPDVKTLMSSHADASEEGANQRLFAINETEIKIEELLFQVASLIPSAYAEIERVAHAAIDCPMPKVNEYSDFKSVRPLEKIFKVDQLKLMGVAKDRAQAVELAVLRATQAQTTILMQSWYRRLHKRIKSLGSNGRPIVSAADTEQEA